MRSPPPSRPQAVSLWCRLIMCSEDGTREVVTTLEGEGLPDLGTVDELAHRLLDARRADREVVVVEVAPEMARLLDLSGLGVEMGWEPEGGEQPVGVERVEEEGHLGDPPA